ncbi:hypothetical protein LV457_08470 [Mycobacterium sp. MYCO198283]|uniref:hypothetical protein n=1 Tax=Mycobacterium sp. MYCO198283 TaxID=2883505 RepID=UPI001E574605|nr:hypothetical protein [Mycobacterium sp. MYCO198283]MCG5432327.1 hypothetical protein [Mycobacterium sp. MYCO198283]
MTDREHGHAPAGRPEDTPASRPEDVDTGFWLWLAALPLLATAYVVNAVALAPRSGAGRVVTLAATAFVVVVLASLVVTFLFLMRQGYRWARSVLAGGGLAAVVVSVSNLFGGDRPPVVAVVYAACVIFGSVLVAGGLVLVHRKDAGQFFTR